MYFMKKLMPHEQIFHFYTITLVSQFQTLLWSGRKTSQLLFLFDHIAQNCNIENIVYYIEQFPLKFTDSNYDLIIE
jgi:hypothetical protein